MMLHAAELSQLVPGDMLTVMGAWKAWWVVGTRLLAHDAAGRRADAHVHSQLIRKLLALRCQPRRAYLDYQAPAAPAWHD